MWAISLNTKLLTRHDCSQSINKEELWIKSMVFILSNKRKNDHLQDFGLLELREESSLVLSGVKVEGCKRAIYWLMSNYSRNILAYE